MLLKDRIIILLLITIILSSVWIFMSGYNAPQGLSFFYLMAIALYRRQKKYSAVLVVGIMSSIFLIYLFFRNDYAAFNTLTVSFYITNLILLILLTFFSFKGLIESRAIKNGSDI